MAASASVILSEATQLVYLEELVKLDPDVLANASQRVIREWDRPSMMPPLSFIFSRSEANPQLLAEAAWEAVQKLVYRDWHPDIGWTRKVELDPHIEYAIRQVGGLHRIHECPTETFNFLRKDFIAAHSRYSAEGGAQNRLSHKQAAQILGDLQQGKLPS